MKLICANFKMNLLKKDIEDYLDKIENKLNKNNVIFFPTALYIEKFSKNNYQVGSQDISFKENGSITGDISILQLKELGINYTLIGHSERRNYFNDNKYINLKLQLALKNNIKVILCIGEHNKKDKLKTKEFLNNQIDSAIKGNLKLIKNDNLIIAYEPIWAIESDCIPSNIECENIIFGIKDYIKNKYNLNLKVLYGGSVNLNNIENLEKINNIDGYLIGTSSLNSEDFLSLTKKIK